MALPVTISGAAIGHHNSYHGPVKSSGGAFYSVLSQSSTISIWTFLKSDDIHCAFQHEFVGGSRRLLGYKATDPTDAWSEQDAGNRPISGQSGEVIYSRFDMSSDVWAEVDTGDEDILVDGAPAGDDGPNAYACSIAVQETGSDIIIAYQGEAKADMGTSYAEIHFALSDDAGETWSAGNIVADHDSGAGAVHFTGPVIVRGSSDRMHIFFKDDTNDDFYQRTLKSDDTLETFPSSYNSLSASPIYPFGHGVSYDDGGTERVRIPSGRSSSGAGRSAKLDSGDAPTVTDEIALDDFPKVINNSSVVSAAVDVKNLLYLYSHQSDQDLYLAQNDDDAGWGIDTEVLDSVTINRIYSNVYDRSGTKLAYIYDDSGTVKYNEVDLGGAPGFIPYPNPRYALTGGMQSMAGGT